MSNNFLKQLQRRRQMHVASTPSHVDAPSEQTMEQLEAEHKRLEIEKTKKEIDYWASRQQANASGGGDGPQFGLKSNQRKFFNFKRSRRSWK